MRWLWLLLVAGCPSPEDAFLLSGRVVDQNGAPRRDTMVRVLRDSSVDSTRCQPMEPFATLETDRDGRYSLSVFRQQQTLGRGLPRFFRVEVTHPSQPTWTSSLVFRFPAVDLTLPDLLISTNGVGPPPGELETFIEGSLDGTVAWRSGVGALIAEERPLEQLRVDRRLFSDVALSAFNMYQSYAIEARLERPISASITDTISRLRSASCDLPGRPCPVTDGRFLPISLPPDTRQVTITAADIVELSQVSIRGLQVEGDPELLVLELNESGGGAAQWKTWLRSQKAREVLTAARNHCREPTGFFAFALAPSLATGLRLRVEDANGDPLPITSLAEVVAR